MYSIEYEKPAIQALERIDHKQRTRIMKAIERLALNPLSASNVKHMSDDLYRLRIGDYRAIYKIYENQILIVVLTVGHRKDIYR